ncbi:hypothetical protein ACF0H5_022192 [Mactra antiquata]
MNRLREKFHVPKAHSLYESHSGKSLETMVKDSFYLAWPVALGAEGFESRRKQLTKSVAFDEGDGMDG